MKRQFISMPVLALIFLLAIPAGSSLQAPPDRHVAAAEGVGDKGSAALQPGAIITLNFDSYADGTRISEQYATQGVHFLNDYLSDRAFRSSPQVKAHAQARSSPNVVVNSYYDWELSSSTNVPMVIWFDQPVTGVGMYLGTIASLQHPCSAGTQVTVTVFDCNGTILGQKSAAVSPAFNTPLEIDDTLGRIRWVEIDNGNTGCPEAIDDFAFQVATTQCTDSTAPKVTITSHGKSDVVNTAAQIIKGYVQENGILKSVKINGVPAQVYMSSGGFYYFTLQVTLQNGANTITVLAEDATGNKGSAQTVLTLGVPASVGLGQFHLTQRGVLQNASCDVDKPLVAGKTALVRIYLSTKTADGLDTYVSSVQMSIWRKTTGADQLVDTMWGTTYSPYLSGFNSPNDMTAIHFLIPGDKLDPAGDYKFTFQPWVGSSSFGAPLVANCGGAYFTFAETKPLRLLILPVEAGINSPYLAGTDYAQAYYAQLDSVVRTFPVRDNWGAKQGLYYTELTPFNLCDGTSITVQTAPSVCLGTGWTWKFIDKDPGGVLRRANDQTVSNLSQNICDPNDHKIGGSIVNTQTFTLGFTSGLGIFRGGAHPSWEGAKYATPMDEDHDGDIDQTDLQHYIAEFYDLQTNKWITDLTKFDTGETFRFFRDQDGDGCNDSATEPQADVRMLWEHGQNILWTPTTLALDAYNKSVPGTANDAGFCSLWFPKKLTAFDNPEFGSYGPGQGDSPGARTWIVLRNTSTMPHEMGHNLGNLVDLYLQSVDPAPDDLVTKENAWATYVGLQSIPPSQMFAAMGADRASDRVVHIKQHYLTLYNALLTSSSAPQPDEPAQQGEQFVVDGWIDPRDHPTGLHTSLATGLEPTPQDSTSPYILAFGTATTTLQIYPFALGPLAPSPEGFDTWPTLLTELHVVAPFPAGTQWVELRHNDRTLARFVRSASAPTVHVVAPNGGESYGATDQVTIRWTSQDLDGGPLSSSLYYSPDGGEHWLVLAAAVSGNEFPWNLANVSGTSGPHGLVRVVTTDGFSSGEDQSDAPFQVGGKAPQVAILDPQPGRTILQCAQLLLRGIALDPEDRLSRVAWSLDGQALDVPQMMAQVGPLDPGVHQIALTALDEQGLTSTSTVTVTVLGDADCDGMSDSYEELYGLNPGLVTDAGRDDDGDGLLNLDEAWYSTHPQVADTDEDGHNDGEEVRQGTNPTDATSTPARLYVSPTESAVSVSEIITVELRLADIQNLYGAQVELSFDPDLLQVLDAYPTVPGVQIQEGELPVPDVSITNQTDNVAGHVYYTVSLQGDKPGVSGGGVLARITFRGRRAGTSALSFTRALLSDPHSVQISAQAVGGRVNVEQRTATLSGRVILERRQSNSGAVVCVGSQCTATDPDGRYTLAGIPFGQQTITVTRTSYLQSQRVVSVYTDTAPPNVTLLGGDINQDRHIETADGASMGLAWNSTRGEARFDERADISADNQVNILDLVAVQFNWDSAAPSPWPGIASGRPAAAAPAATRVVISPNVASLGGAGETTTLDIRVEEVAKLYAGRIQLSFNPHVLHVRDMDPRPSAPGVQILPGDFLDPFNQQVLVNRADNDAGTMDFAVTQTYPATAKSGSGILARIVFEAVGRGSSVVHLTQARLLDDTQPDPLEIPAGTQDGQVVVGAHTLYLPLIMRAE